MFGLRHRWTYFLRTLPDIAPFLEPLEHAIADLLVPAITEHVITQEEWNLETSPGGGEGREELTRSGIGYHMVPSSQQVWEQNKAKLLQCNTQPYQCTMG